MFIIDGEVDVLARAMITNYPKDAAVRAEMRSNAFFVLGYSEKSDKWLRVSEEIKKIQADIGAQTVHPAAIGANQ